MRYLLFTASVLLTAFALTVTGFESFAGANCPTNSVQKIELAKKYITGDDGVPEDHTQAQTLMKEASETGDVDAMAEYALHLITYAEYDTAFYTEAKEVLDKVLAKEPEHLLALNTLGIWHKRHGDSAKAFELFSKTAQKGLPEGLCDLGICYRNGESVKRDIEHSKKLLEQSIKLKPLSSTIIHLAQIYLEEGDTTTSTDVLRKGALAKLPSCLGLYLDQKYAAEEPNLSFKHLMQELSEMRAADASEDKSYYDFYLASVCCNPNNPFYDYAKAMDLYQQLAKDGHNTALSAIGLMYKLGTGVPQDFQKAYEYILRCDSFGIWENKPHLAYFYDGQANASVLPPMEQYRDKAGVTYFKVRLGNSNSLNLDEIGSLKVEQGALQNTDTTFCSQMLPFTITNLAQHAVDLTFNNVQFAPSYVFYNYKDMDVAILKRLDNTDCEADSAHLEPGESVSLAVTYYSCNPSNNCTLNVPAIVSSPENELSRKIKLIFPELPIASQKESGSDEPDVNILPVGPDKIPLKIFSNVTEYGWVGMVIDDYNKSMPQFCISTNPNETFFTDERGKRYQVTIDEGWSMDDSENYFSDEWLVCPIYAMYPNAFDIPLDLGDKKPEWLQGQITVKLSLNPDGEKYIIKTPKLTYGEF